MLERFTERARRAMVLATDEARARRHEAVGPEHVLLGLVRDGAGFGAQVLGRLQVDVERLRAEVERLLDAIPAAADPVEPRFSAELKTVLEASVEEQRRLQHNWIGTEHLLLGLLDARSTVNTLLRALGAELDDARRMIAQVFAGARENVRAFRPARS